MNGALLPSVPRITQMFFQREAFARTRAGHGLDRGGLAACKLVKTDQGYAHLGRAGRAEEFARRLFVPGGQRLAELVAKSIEIRQPARHRDRAFDHHRDRQNGKQNEQPQDPFRSE